MQKIITINEKFNTMKSFFRQKLSLRSEADANQKMIKFVSKNLNFSSLRLHFSKNSASTKQGIIRVLAKFRQIQLEIKVYSDGKNKCVSGINETRHLQG
jgi:uncharacterized protein YggU (UPF0235/DUF167 family)